MKKKPLILHPLLLAVNPVLTVYATGNNGFFIDVSQIFAALVISVTVTIFLWATLGFLLRNSLKAAFIISFLLILFFSYGHFYHTVRPQMVWLEDLESHAVYGSVWLLLFAGGVALIRKVERHLGKFNDGMNICFLAMFVLTMYRAVKTNYLLEDGHHKIEDSVALEPRAEEQRPDVYYIILDAYGNSRFLKERYNFDNSDFTDYLTDTGFVVASDSRSNYQNTYQSLSSSLNMNYQSRKQPLQMSYNLVMHNFKQLGYKIIAIQASTSKTPIHMADVNELCGGYSEFDMTLIDTTLLTAFKKWFRTFDFQLEHRNKMACALEKIPEVHKQYKEPVFVFAHIVSPHPPYIFGENGPLSDQEISRHREAKMSILAINESWHPENIDLYLQQTLYLNKRVQVIVEDLLAISETPPIIIIQSDHGPSFEDWDRTKKALNNDLPDMVDDQVRWKVAGRSYILNAYYLPSEHRHKIYPTITPVNSFWVVFGVILDADVDLLEDKVYWYDYRDVTDISMPRSE